MKAMIEQLHRLGDLWAADSSRLATWIHERCRADADARQAEAEMRKGTVPRVRGRVAILPLQGVMTKRGSWAGVSTDAFGAAFDAALAAKEISGIVIDGDTPGGVVWGTPELAEKVFAARGVKPTVTVANSLLASAGYWVGSSADQLIVSPSGDVGSIGVWNLHMDFSEALAEMGIKPTFISAGKYKVAANPYEPLSDDGRAVVQESVDDSFNEFVAGVAKNFKVKPAAVKSGFGEGRVVGAKRALSLGMIHGIASLEDVLRRMGGTTTDSRDRGVEAELRSAYLSAWKVSEDSEPEVNSDSSSAKGRLTPEQAALRRKNRQRRFDCSRVHP